MKDFSDFENFCAKHVDELTYEIANKLNDVSESQRTMTEEEWIFVQKMIIHSNMAFLRWYHGFFHEEQY